MNHSFSTLSELNRSTDMIKGISESYNSYRMGLISASEFVAAITDGLSVLGADQVLRQKVNETLEPIAEYICNNIETGAAYSLEDYGKNSNDNNTWKKGIRFKARS